jgi:hypothetical protein
MAGYVSLLQLDRTSFTVVGVAEITEIVAASAVLTSLQMM